MIESMDKGTVEFLSDESGLTGQAESISFPGSEDDIRQLLKALPGRACITVQGSRTGVSGAAVPAGGHILNLSAMNKISDIQKENGLTLLRVQPGVTLEGLESHLEKSGMFWPVNPTEKTATIGGITAANAAGPLAYGYGPTQTHIKSLSVMTLEGGVDHIQKDLFGPYLGSEGMLGVITEVELILTPRPGEQWGVVFFFATPERALNFLQDADLMSRPENLVLASLEFMNNTCLDTIKEFIQDAGHLPPGDTSAVCLELHGPGFSDLEPMLEHLMETARVHGSDPDKTWAFSGVGELDGFHRLQHGAMASLVSLARQAPKNFWVLDLKVEYDQIKAVLTRAAKALEALKIRFSIFGSAAGKFRLALHLRSQDHGSAKIWMDAWINPTPGSGYAVIAGYGVGKINHPILDTGDVQKLKQEIWTLKKRSDPLTLWNPFNMEKRINR